MLRIMRARLSNAFSFCIRPFLSNKEAILSSYSSESLINDEAPSASPSESVSKNLSSFFLKFALFGSLAGATAGAYTAASYAYTLDEVDEKTKAFRAYANYTVGENASALDKFCMAVVLSANLITTTII